MQIGVVVGILNTLLTSKRVTTMQLAEKYEMSRRSIIRYVEALSEGGVPVITYRGRYGGYGIIDSYKMTAQFFTSTEYERLINSVESLPVDDVNRSIIDKLKGLKSAQGAHYTLSDKVIIDTGFSPAFENKFKALQKAISNRLVTEITYMDKEGKQTDRTVYPCNFVYKDNIWYVYAWCDMRQDFRFFKLNRIVGISLTDDVFPPQIIDVNATALNSFVEEKQKITVTLAVDNRAVVEVAEWLGEDSIIKKGTDYRAVATLPNDDFLINKLVTFGDKVKIIEPQSLQDEFIGKLSALQKIYMPTIRGKKTLYRLSEKRLVPEKLSDSALKRLR